MGLEAGRVKRRTTTGVVDGVSGTAGVIFSTVRLVAGVDAATCVVREGGSGGTILATLKAAIEGTDEWRPGRSWAEGELHVTLTGTAPEVSVSVG
jgi:hypothetical protein